jgi:hypothetical protein
MAGVAGTLGTAALGASVWRATSRHLLEECAYTLRGAVGPVELRQYPPMVVVAVQVPGEFDDATTEGYRRLRGYLSGRNVGGHLYAMTSPLRIERLDAGVKLAVPLPREIPLEQFPHPYGEGVHLERLPQRTYAVLRFTGWTPERRWVQKEQELLRLIGNAGWRLKGDVQWAQFDQALAFPVLRRNEVMAAIEPLAAV